jgi:hypothetical protein
MVVDRVSQGLDHERVSTSNTFADLHQGLAITKFLYPGTTWIYAEVIAYALRQLSVTVATDDSQTYRRHFQRS